MGSSAGKGARTERSGRVSRIEANIALLLTELSAVSDAPVMVSYGVSTFPYR